MKLKIMFTTAILAMFVIGIVFTKADDTVAKGKEVFLAKKCEACHAVATQGIEAKRKSDKVPDLSKVDLKDKADWVKQYLNKEADKDGKKHAIKFNGTEEELSELATWLTTVGVPAEEKK
jgi:hypothetical protein